MGNVLRFALHEAAVAPKKSAAKATPPPSSETAKKTAPIKAKAPSDAVNVSDAPKPKAAKAKAPAPAKAPEAPAPETTSIAPAIDTAIKATAPEPEAKVTRPTGGWSSDRTLDFSSLKKAPSDVRFKPNSPIQAMKKAGIPLPKATWQTSTDNLIKRATGLTPKTHLSKPAATTTSASTPAPEAPKAPAPSSTPKPAARPDWTSDFDSSDLPNFGPPQVGSTFGSFPAVKATPTGSALKNYSNTANRPAPKPSSVPVPKSLGGYPTSEPEKTTSKVGLKTKLGGYLAGAAHGGFNALKSVGSAAKALTSYGDSWVKSSQFRGRM